MQTSANLAIDKRRIKNDQTFTIIIRLCHFQKTTSISTGKSIPLHYWDDKNKKVRANYGRKSDVNLLNQFLYEQLGKARNIINVLELKNELRFLSINQVKERISKRRKFDSFFEYGDKLVEDLIKANRLGSAKSYRGLLTRLRSYTKKKDLKFNDINYEFLVNFETFHLSNNNSLNGLASYLRTLRSIYNKAIKDRLIEKEAYPFNDYQIKTTPTSKRAIQYESVLKLLHYKTEKGSWPFHYKNYFLISYLLFGMSFIDMAFLKKKNIVGDRIKFQRKKTSKNYNILITDQLMEILDFYLVDKENDDFILPILNSNTLTEQYKQVQEARNRYNKGLRRIAKQCGIKEYLTSYVSRHSFATHAMLKDIPLHVISSMLGHSKLNTTQIYLDSLPTTILDKYHKQLTLV
jgi:site-specific recombinase XerD